MVLKLGGKPREKRERERERVSGALDVRNKGVREDSRGEGRERERWKKVEW